ncbi:MAG TPA: metallophosphoesterase [Dongiaceae bacterium]|nr:metallophosphoesterase [Dongiaceae bacterium]
MRLAAVGGGIVFASRLATTRILAADDFYFVQLSDTHWGFQDPKVNPDPRASLRSAVAAVVSLSQPPDFVVFTGDLTHKTDDGAERRKRMAEFKDIIQPLSGLRTIFLPGEHDAAADQGAAFKENFGVTHQSFDHKGIHFVTLDNVSDPKGLVGEEQLAWLAGDLKPLDRAQPVVVFTHRPLWDLKPDWDWFTGDGSKVVDLLSPFKAATVFYGHIHQENHHMTGSVTHISARSALYPLPAPGAQPKKAPLPWDAAAKDHGIGWRRIEAAASGIKTEEHPTA